MSVSDILLSGMPGPRLMRSEVKLYAVHIIDRQRCPDNAYDNKAKRNRTLTTAYFTLGIISI